MPAFAFAPTRRPVPGPASAFAGETQAGRTPAAPAEVALVVPMRLLETTKEVAKMPEYRIRVAPNTVAYADGEKHKLVVEFAIPGAPTDTIDVKILEDSVHLTAPARDIEYVAALALGWPVKPDKAEATYEHGLLRIEVPFKDPMEDAVKVAIKAGGVDSKTKSIEA